MKLHAVVEIAHPRDAVFAAYRDELIALVPFLPNVRSITPQARTERGDVVEVVSRWQGGADLPAVVRKVLSEERLAWDDHARWDAARHVCHWRTEVGAFREALRSAGETRFEAVSASATRVTIEGDVAVDARKIAAVPRLFASTVGPAAESFLVKTIRPNVVAVAEAVGRLLTERAPR